MPKTYTLSQIANELGLSYQGDDITITRVNTLEEAISTELSFLANPKYTAQLSQTKAGAVIIRKEHAHEVKNAIICEEPYYAFAQCMALFSEPEGTFTGVSPFASIDPSAEIGENCTIYPYVYIGANVKLGDNCKLFPGTYIGENCLIGEDCTIYPNSVLMSRTVLGDNCTIQPGAILGTDGYGFVRTPHGIHKIPQIGKVEIGEKVEVGANAAIDRAALSATRVGDGTCIDNLVQIGHNVTIGKDCFIISQVGIAGSATIGDNCTLAGQAGIAGHLNIGNNVTIGPQAGVAKDIEANKIVSGSPTTDYSTYMRISALMPKLPDLFKRMSKIEKAFAALDLLESQEKKEK